MSDRSLPSAGHRSLGRVCLCLALGLSWDAGATVAARAEGTPLVDPTRPASHLRPATSANEASRLALSLSAIIVAEDRRLAVINETRVRPGDRIGGAEVVAIDATRVRLRAGGKTFVLGLIETPVKAKAEPEK